MANAVLLKGGGGGTTSDELTATAGDVLVGKTAVTKDSNDEPIAGTLQTMNGGSWNPGTSVVTVACQNKKMLGNITINPYPNMNGGTYTPSTSRQTISCAGKVMNSNVIIKAVPVMSGGTWTPSKSAITIACAGKRMSGNIVINAIPSGFVNVGSETFLTNGQALGPFVNLGFSNTTVNANVRGTQAAIGGPEEGGFNCYTVDIKTYTKLDITKAGTFGGWESYSFGGYYGWNAMGFNGSIDMTPFSKLRIFLYFSTTSQCDFYFYLIQPNYKKASLYFVIHKSYITGSGTTSGHVTATIPIKNITGHHFITMKGFHGNGIGGWGLRSLKLIV